MSREAWSGGSGEMLCAKSAFFFLVQAANGNDQSLPPALLAGFSKMKRKTVLFSVFGYYNSCPRR